MADLKNLVHDYLAQRHFDLMPADVKDRFDQYDKLGSFTGHMKTWSEKYVGSPLNGLETTITDANDWEELYDSCQKAFQGMDAAKTNSTGYGSPYNNPTKDFINEWFGDDDSKVFTDSKPTPHVKTVFKDLGKFLKDNRSVLKSRFENKLPSVFNENMKYDTFCKKLEDGDFDKDKDGFRDKIESVVNYITNYGPQRGSEVPPDDEYWPSGTPVGYDMAGPPGPGGGPTVLLTSAELTALYTPPFDKDDPKKWYEIPDKAKRIGWFKTNAYKKIFDKLLTSSTIRTKFLEKTGYNSVIKDALESAIADTDYENKESDDYVPPDPVDVKNFPQKVKKWKNDTYENHFRRFFDHNRGARVFYSPFSQNIMKGLDKAGVKPTEGLDGIINKKDDPKLRGVVDSDRVTKKHFDWFVKTMGTIKEQIPDAYEGALRNGHQLRQVAMYIITIAAKEGEAAKAKTALEVLSVAKYGLTMSRTYESLKEATKDMKIFSDDQLSWNKNEGLKFVTGAIDKTLGLAIRGAGLAATTIHNFIQHRRTKIGNNIGKYKHLKGEYEQWAKNDADKRANLVTENAKRNVTLKLTTLAAGSGLSGRVIANDADLELAKTDLGLMPPGPAHDDLEKDIKLYEDASKRHKLETDPDEWRKDNPDTIHDLIAYWDMLESYGKTHSFALGSMKVKRENFLENWKKKTSEAQITADDYIKNFGSLRTT